jgi:hypothetical protein
VEKLWKIPGHLLNFRQFRIPRFIFHLNVSWPSLSSSWWHYSAQTLTNERKRRIPQILKIYCYKSHLIPNFYYFFPEISSLMTRFKIKNGFCVLKHWRTNAKPMNFFSSFASVYQYLSTQTQFFFKSRH